MEEGGEEARDEDVRSREGLGAVGVELGRVGDVEGVLLDGQGEGRSRHGEERAKIDTPPSWLFQRICDGETLDLCQTL